MIKITMLKNPFIRVLVITLIILLLPLILQLTIGTGVEGQGFNWKLGDFILIGLLVFTAGLLIDISIRKAGKYKLTAVTVVVLGFFLLYVELAVGLFTNWGI